MNRTIATCIAGMRSKTTTGIKTHFQRRKKPRGRSLLRGFGVGIFAKRLRWRPERNPPVTISRRVRRSLLRGDSSCTSSANPPSSSEHVEHGLQHADDRAAGAVHAFVEPAQPVEMTEELVGAVDEVNDHFGSVLDLVKPCEEFADVSLCGPIIIWKDGKVREVPA
jgi:hypothetical protein